MIPIMADVFVFSYPIYLLALYFYWMNKRKNYYKDAALLLFFASFGSVFVNILIQMFIVKARPDVVLDMFLESREWLFLQTLPKDTFPSDHAALAAAIATVTLMRGLKHKDKLFVRLSFPFILFAIIMGLGRITVGIHRPTDIIVWTIVGILVWLLVFCTPILKFLRNVIFKWIIHIQEWLWEKVFGTKR